MSDINPYEVLSLRRKLKKYKTVGIAEGMKALHRLRSLNLTKKILISTEVTRTLLWVSERTKDYGENEELSKFNVMLRYLVKEYKKVLIPAEDKKGE